MTSVILVASSFLTPVESRNANNLTRVRMFDTEKLTGDVAKDKWDLIKIVCTQPFNKTLKYGFSFITVHSVEEVKKEVKLGAFKLKNDDEDNSVSSVGIGRFFKKESVATTLRSQETLASIAVNSTENANRKRKMHEARGAPEHQPVKKKKEIKIADRKLPRRDILEPGYTPKPSKKAAECDVMPKVVSHSISDTPPEESKKFAKKPFDKLMEGVVFVLSGFQNPLRGDLRQMALELGAKYRGDWDNSCTHLVCAFPNTPKFNQVKGKGKIVKKEWLEKCHRDRKRWPWRRFCLDPKDQGNESEEEIHEDTGKEDPDWMFKPGNSGGICGTEGITCSYKGFWEGGCSTFTGRDLNFIV